MAFGDQKLGFKTLVPDGAMLWNWNYATLFSLPVFVFGHKAELKHQNEQKY